MSQDQNINMTQSKVNTNNSHKMFRVIPSCYVRMKREKMICRVKSARPWVQHSHSLHS